MFAMTYRNYGPASVLQPKEYTIPVPKDDQVLVRAHTSTVTPVDCQFRAGNPRIVRLYMGLFRPGKNTVLGTELAGVVHAVGKDVTRFQVGDQVFAATADGTGAHAEYICLPANGAIALKPQSISLGEAATICNGGLTALPFLRDHGNIKPGDKVLIIGASGSIGTMAVQLAKHFGARVTGVCSGANADLVRSLGAEQVIDYGLTDFADQGDVYDIIFDTVAKTSFAKARRALKPGGAYLVTVPSFATVLRMLHNLLFGGQRAVMAATGLRPAADQRRDMEYLSGLIDRGILTTVIERHYPFASLAAAHSFVETGRKKGNVVVSFC